MEAVYRFDQMKSEKSEVRRPLRKLTLSVPQRSDLAAGEAAAARGLAIAHGMDLARDLGNLPGNVCTPTYLGEQALELAQASSPTSRSTVLERKEIEELGMGSFLSVTNGSDEPPRFIVFEYHGAAKTQTPVVLVGKGITFDTGGISLKPGADMDEMKFDMCGAASVFGTLRAVAELKAEVNVVGLVAACENMPSRPRDQAGRRRHEHVGADDRDPQHRRRGPPDPVRRAHLRRALRAGGGGRHRDADRRLVIALGPRRARPVQQQRRARARSCSRAGDDAYDRGWQHAAVGRLPGGARRATSPTSPTSAGRAGGSITAACFLSRFAKKFDWAHLDIAGVAWKEGKEKGATGRPVPLLTTWLLSQEPAAA